MEARLTKATTVAVVLLPLAIGLVIGSVVAWTTLSWENAFVPWQLFCWSLVSLAIGIATNITVDRTERIVPSGLPDRELSQFLRVTKFVFKIRGFLLLGSFAISIYVTIVSDVTVEAYWSLPVAAFFYAVAGPGSTRLSNLKDSRYRADRESKRKSRCSELTSDQIAEYQANFMLTFYDVWLKTRQDAVPLEDILSEPHHECEPELLSGTLRRWIDYGCIKVEWREAPKAPSYISSQKQKMRLPQEQVVFLLENGRQICVRAKVTGMTTALRDHEKCLTLSDTEKSSFIDHFLIYIGRLTDNGSKVVHRADLFAPDGLPCALELGKQALQVLSDLKLIDPARPVPDGRTYASPGVALTGTGKRIIDIMKTAGTAQKALSEHAAQLQQEEERHMRCLETTSSQRIDFEDQFLQALYLTTSGDTRQVEVGDVWKRLKHDCAKELTPHALRVWYERKCIALYPLWMEEKDHWRVIDLAGNGTDLSLTAKGRDLCERALIQGSIQEALSQSAEGYLVEKHEYHVHDSQIMSVGSHNDVHDNSFALFARVASVDQLDKLAQEFAAIRIELAERANSPEHYIAMGSLAEAEVAARDGDPQRVWQHLAKVGGWVLDTAKDIGKSLAVEAIVTVFKAHNIPL